MRPQSSPSSNASLDMHNTTYTSWHVNAASFWKASLLSFAPYNGATPDCEVRKQKCMISTHLNDV